MKMMQLHQQICNGSRLREKISWNADFGTA